MAPFGIDVIVVEPGGIKRDWGIIAAQNLKTVSKKGVYTAAASKTAEGMINLYSGNRLSKPELIAKTIAKSVTERRPKTRYLVGFMAKPMVLIKNVFGYHAYDRVIKMFY